MAIFHAWILPVSTTSNVAVGEYELKHVESQIVTLAIPLSPRYCNKVLSWHQRMLPLLDVNLLLHTADKKTPSTSPTASTKAIDLQPAFAGIIAYQRASNGTVDFGAIKLVAPPQRVEVSDQQQANFPDESPHWQRVAHACFNIDNRTYPVLNLSALFSKTGAELLLHEPDLCDV